MARGSRRGPFQPALAPPFHGGSWLESNGMPEGGGVTARCGHQPTIRTQKRRKPPRLPLAAPRNSFSCQPPTIRTPGARSLRRAPSVDARASTTRRLSRSASDFGTSASQDTRSAPRKGCQGEIEPASREGAAITLSCSRSSRLTRCATSLARVVPRKMAAGSRYGARPSRGRRER